MASFINKSLEHCLKVAGIWPYGQNYIRQFILLSAIITTLPFQCWNTLSLTNDPMLLMDSLSDIITEILIFIKFFFMWINRKLES